MSKQLATYVHVFDENHETHVFGPGDKVPGWAKKQITNPKAWAAAESDDDLDEDLESDDETEELEDDDSEHEESEDDDSEEDDDESSSLPPQRGKGSGVARWRRYAEANEFEVDEDAGRDEIIAALKANDIPVE